MADVGTIVTFTGDNGAHPEAGLILDGQGNLYGTTQDGGANNDGSVFEITKAGIGYSSTPITVASFDGNDGSFPLSGLIADSAGNLYGTTNGGNSIYGSVFEITKTGTGYSSQPTTLVAFTGDGTSGQKPAASLIFDSAGNLYGTTTAGPTQNDFGTVFEIAKSGTGYSPTPTTLASFNGSDQGRSPKSDLIADAAGNLYGTTNAGGANNGGTVFEIAKLGTGYSSTPITIVAFNGSQGPGFHLTFDSSGNLYGTTFNGGNYNDGTVFEIAKTQTGYSNTPTTLASFNGADGQGPQTGVIFDAAGNLYGTTLGGGTSGDGTVFRIDKVGAGYSNTPTTLVSFNGTNGYQPESALIADASGTLYGTTAFSGASGNGDGLVYEVTNSGFVTCFAAGTRISIARGGAIVEIAVETLTVGDFVVTASGAHRPIRWLGHRTVDCRRHTRPLEAQPVRITAHALGPNRPAHDLRVSPGHAICVDLLGEVLIPAGALINGSTIVQQEVDTVTYWHVELEGGHDILLAENLPCESYIEMGNRAFFAEAEATALHASPDAREITHADFCRPFHKDGPVVALVRDRLAARAPDLGWTLAHEPLADLHLVADGRRIDPEAVGLAARFLVPADADDVWLVSDTSVPAEIGVAPDLRQLGVCVGALVVDDGFGTPRTIPADDPRLCVGFHHVEEGPQRWTAGRTRLPANLWEECRGSFFLRVELTRPALPKWVLAGAPSRYDEARVGR